jgi:hypothetical protein
MPDAEIPDNTIVEAVSLPRKSLLLVVIDQMVNLLFVYALHTCIRIAHSGSYIRRGK